jgi:hypothetical protein
MAAQAALSKRGVAVRIPPVDISNPSFARVAEAIGFHAGRVEHADSTRRRKIGLLNLALRSSTLSPTAWS